MAATHDQFTNWGQTTVAGGAGGAGTALNPGDTTMTVADTTKLPTTTPATLVLSSGTSYEIVKVSNIAAGVYTLVRAQEGTTALTFGVGSGVASEFTAGSAANLWTRVQAPVYDVRDYGAVADGVTDDRAAIQAALDAAHTAGGGVVRLMAGTHLLNSTVTTSLNGVTSCLVTYSHVTLCGLGRDATTLKFGATLPDLTRGIVNYNNNTSGAGDTQITLMDFTLDGNNANQSSLNAQSGVFLQYTQGAVVERVRFLNIYGTGSSGVAEGFFCTIDTSSDASVVSCICANTGVNASSGFSANYSTNLAYTNCTAYGMTHSMGFTNYGCTHVSHVNCASYSNAEHGFNTEVGTDIAYANCHSGLTAASQGGFNAYPFTSGQALGNTQSGFTVRGSQRVTLSGCVAEHNGAHGVNIYQATTEGINGQFVSILGGSYSFNTGYAVLADASATGFVRVSGRPRFTGNTGGVFSVFVNGAATSAFAGGTQPNPTLSSGVALTSPFPLDSWLILTGGTVTAIALDGSSVASATPATVYVPAGSSITVTFSVAPTTAWHALFT